MRHGLQYVRAYSAMLPQDRRRETRRKHGDEISVGKDETFTASSLHRERATRIASSSRHSRGTVCRRAAVALRLTLEGIVLVDRFDIAFPVRLNYCADMPDVFKYYRAVHAAWRGP